MRRQVIRVKKMLVLAIFLGFLTNYSYSQDTDSETGVTDDENSVIDNSTPEDIEINTDVEDRLDENAFTERYSSYYDEWDMDDNDNLDENELYDGYFNLWDQDENESIDENEWKDMKETLGDVKEEVQSWDVLDTNKDNKIDKNEFETKGKELDLHNKWDEDKDKKMNKEEFLGGLFSEWDLNEDGFLDKDERDESFFDIDLKKDTEE